VAINLKRVLILVLVILVLNFNNSWSIPTIYTSNKLVESIVSKIIGNSYRIELLTEFNINNGKNIINLDSTQIDVDGLLIYINDNYDVIESSKSKINKICLMSLLNPEKLIYSNTMEGRLIKKDSLTNANTKKDIPNKPKNEIIIKDTKQFNSEIFFDSNLLILLNDTLCKELAFRLDSTELGKFTTNSSIQNKRINILGKELNQRLKLNSEVSGFKNQITINNSLIYLLKKSNLKFKNYEMKIDKNVPDLEGVKQLFRQYLLKNKIDKVIYNKENLDYHLIIEQVCIDLKISYSAIDYNYKKEQNNRTLNLPSYLLELVGRL
jgi:hypothetical protein